MKRLQWLHLLCLGSILLFASCGGEEGVASTVTSSPTPTVTPAAARGEDRPTPSAGLVAPEIITTDATPADETTEGTEVVYVVPFHVQPDGFSFRNYGAGYPEGAFTIDDLREQFGDAVCSRIATDGEECIPSAEAQQWIEDRNADMRSGHCIGFTVTSFQFAQGELEPSDFSESATVPYDIQQEVPIMRTIAANGSLYWVRSVWTSEVSGTPREVIDALIDLGQPVDLSIYLPGLAGGHSLLAYGVERTDAQSYRILVYDNNFPGEERYVVVNYEDDTWRYDDGKVNPNETAVPYEGDAATKTLRFIPLTAYETVTCPFCVAEEEQASSEAINLLSFLGQGDVLVKTALGTISSVAGEILNEIPGAQFIFHRGQLAGTDAPDIALPAGTDYTIQFSGLERVSSLSPDLSLVIDHLAPAIQDSEIGVTLDSSGINFLSGGDQTPSLTVTVREEDSSYSIVLLGIEYADGQGLSMRAAEGGEGLELRPLDVDVKDATLLVTRLTPEDESVFASSKLSIQQGAGVALDIAAWDGTGSIDIYTDGNGDGDYADPPTKLENQPLTDVLQESDAAEAAAIIGSLSPYVGRQDVASLLDDLADQNLSGSEIGEILRPLDLTNEQLIRFIPSLALPIPELGDLLYALRLGPDRLAIVVDGLDLTADEERQLVAYLRELAFYHAIVVEWEFLDSNDMVQLADFLNERDLTAEQMLLLLPLFRLTPTELGELLGVLNLPSDEIDFLAEQFGVLVKSGPGPKTTPQGPQVGTATATATVITLTPSSTVAPTVTPTLTPTLNGTPAATATPQPYPGALPAPTRTPNAYPYPGPLATPSPTSRPAPYPGAGPTATPEFQSSAFCVGNDLRVVAQEPIWQDIDIEIWAGEEILATGRIEPDGKPFEVLLAGPNRWEDLSIRAPIPPTIVPLGTISCPVR